MVITKKLNKGIGSTAETRKLKKPITTWFIIKRVRGFDNLFSLTRFFPRVKNNFFYVKCAQ